MSAVATATGTAAAATVVTSATRLGARATLLGEAPALLRARPDLRQDEVVLGPLDEDLLPDELLDRLEVQRAGLVHERDRRAAGAGAGGATDAVDVVLRLLGEVPVDDVGPRLAVKAH